jgi:tRNA 2-selenouridine synthase
MKYPALFTADACLVQVEQYDSIIDVRSESEYALDHIPGAINCPVLNDAQRIEVGTLYKQTSAFEAKKIGAALVAENIALHLKQKFRDQPRDWKPLIYCWRGGNRSGAMAHIFAKIGWPVHQLDGGYKEYRRFITQQIDQQAQALSFQVICGPTGSGKSRLLQTLAAQGAQVLDLEKLAAHRGSVLGHLPTESQPTQKMFESRIWQTLRHYVADRPVYVESESKKIGNCRVPELLMEKMRASPCIALELSAESRVQLLMEDYAHFVQQPHLLSVQLDHLLTLHGREKIKRWHAMAESDDLTNLVLELLTEHYDPAYLRSIQRNFLQLSSAQSLALENISTNAFLQAANALLS